MSDHPGTADDALLAEEIAAEAGRRLLALRAGHEPAGLDGTAAGRTARLRDAGDKLSHEYITAELARRRPHDAVLSEEGPAVTGRPARLTADRVWIVDPLDGTREFGEPGRSDWAVHVALWQRTHAAAGQAWDRASARAADQAAGHAPDRTADQVPDRTADQAAGRLTAGAVALPAQGVTLTTRNGAKSGAARANAGAARVNAGAAETGPARKPLRIVVSRSRCPPIAESVAELLGAELVPLGSAGAKVGAVMAGAADVYIHAGGFYEWDTAAPVAVAGSAGFHASHLDGGPLRFNREDVWTPDILVCPAALAGTLLNAIAAVRSGQFTGDAPAIG